MIDKVRKILGLSSRKTGNKLILSVEKLESRVALLENGRLEEYSVERKSSRNIVGSIYKGKVKNIEMGLKAMFVDIGFEKNAFLHFWDAIPAALDSGIEEIDQWAKVEQAIRENPAPRRLFEEPDLVERTVRDFLTEEIDEVVCDDRVSAERMSEMIGQISRRARNRVHFYDSAAPIFDTYGVQKQIDDAFHRQVWLKCGGYIVIDETEALVAIDVNTGRNKGGRDVEKTILQTNLEAADEIARQLRLGNIGGLIIGDFIDMKSRKDQQEIYNY